MKPLVERMLFLPGLALAELEKVAPDLVQRGRTQVGNARIMGQMAVHMGGQELARRAEGLQGMLREAMVDAGLAAPVVTSPPASNGNLASERSTEASTGRADVEVPGGPGRDPVGPASLALTDYDSLAASQIVKRLAALDAADLEAVRRYEMANRARKTILGRIAQLQG